MSYLGPTQHLPQERVLARPRLVGHVAEEKDVRVVDGSAQAFVDRSLGGGLQKADTIGRGRGVFSVCSSQYQQNRVLRYQ